MTEKRAVKLDLYKAGVVADLSFSVWGAWAKLREDDLGLSDVPEDIISLGHKKLAKKENLKEIDTVVHKARNFFKLNSFSFPFGGARFIPYARLQRVVSRMQESEKDFNEKTGILFKEYPEIKAKMLKEYDEAFEKLLKQKSNASDEVIKEQKKKLIARVEEKYPSLNDLKNRFAFDFVIFEISDPEFKKVSSEKAVNKAAKLDALEKAYREKVSTRLDGFVNEVIATLKGMVLDTVKKMQDRIEKDAVKMSTIRSFKKFTETFREMDFVDTNIDIALRRLEDKIKDVDKSQLDDAAFKESLSKELEAIKEAASTVDYDTTMKRFRRMLRVEATE